MRVWNFFLDFYSREECNIVLLYDTKLVKSYYKTASILLKLTSMYPYQLTSDTLQRIIFYAIAIESNKDSTLIFEEPESHAFPYYTKWLGEKIGADTTNQYFIATHNPYLLQAVLEKTKKDDIQVFVTYYRNYQTKVIPLDPNQVSEIMTNDPFFNLDEFIPEEEG